MLSLWCAAIAAAVIVATQSAPRTWLAYSWVAACYVLAIVATVMHQIERRQRRRWAAGDYD